MKMKNKYFIDVMKPLREKLLKRLGKEIKKSKISIVKIDYKKYKPYLTRTRKLAVLLSPTEARILTKKQAKEVIEAKVVDYKLSELNYE